MARPGQPPQRVAHLLQFGDAAVEVRDMLGRHKLDLPARPLALPKRYEHADALNREAEFARPVDEAQRARVLARILPVARPRPLRRRDQADPLIVSDHLRADAGCARRLADIHAALRPRALPDGTAIIPSSPLTFQRWKTPPRLPEEGETAMLTLKVNGMTCEHCAAAVTKAVQAVPEADDVRVDLDRGQVDVGGHPDPQAVRAAIEEEGYEVA
jgi:copper chaperone